MTSNENQTTIVILAAGLGTRMKSNKAKVLHTLQHRPMIHYVVDTAVKVTGKNVIVVTGHQSEEVRATVLSRTPDISFAYQDQQLGTGHAVMCALPEIKQNIRDVVILCGDVPLLSPGTICQLIKDHRKMSNHVTVLGVKIEDPTGYGRMITDQSGHLIKIVEEADADSAEKKINIINSGIYCVDRDFLFQALELINPNNAQQEYYLTDIIGIGRQNNKTVGLCIGSNTTEVMGINSIQDLENVEQILSTEKRKTS